RPRHAARGSGTGPSGAPRPRHKLLAKAQSCRDTICPRKDPRGPGQGDAQPVRTVCELVLALIENLFEQEEVEQTVGLFAIGRPEPAIVKALLVGADNGVGGPLAPVVQALCDLAMLARCRFQCSIEGRSRGVVDGADEAGKIARRPRLAPALLQGAARLSLEVD